MIRLYFLILVCIYAVTLPLLAVVDKRNGITIRRDMTINGIATVKNEINGQTIAATPTATATSTATSTATATATATVASAPTLVSATVAANGTTFTLVWSAAVTVGAGCTDWEFLLGNSQLTLFSDPSDAKIVSGAYVSGDGTTTIIFTVNDHAPVTHSDTCTFSFTGGGLGSDCIVAVVGGAEVESFGDFPVTNNSVQ